MLAELSLAVISDWATTLTLIFGGCCSNALTLEQITSNYPNSGSLITFAQFLGITIHGLPKFIIFKPYPKFRPRRIPILPYLLQVALFYAVSLLNNAAFAYRIPMAVHIIFRSGGLVVNMIMGWLFRGKRYSIIQIVSVLIVTGGVILTTFSASKPKPSKASQPTATSVHDHTKTYAIGICILTLALVLSGFLGMVQDKTYTTYTRHVPPNAEHGSKNDLQPPAWQESMFYIHLLSMPMFYFLRNDLVSQLVVLNASSTTQLIIPSPSHVITTFAHNSTHALTNESTLRHGCPTPVSLPSGYIPLILNTLTQIICVAGVHRLTSRVSSLTVTLVLVVRKAISLLISIMLFGSKGTEPENRTMMWIGAALVFIGTVFYSMAPHGPMQPRSKDE